MSGTECDYETRTSATSFVRLDDEEDNLALVETFTVNLRPKILIVSSSQGGYVSGTMPLQARSSNRSIKLNPNASHGTYEFGLTSESVWSMGDDAGERDDAGGGRYADAWLVDEPHSYEGYYEGESIACATFLAMAQLAGSASESGVTLTDGNTSASYYLEKYMGEVNRRTVPVRSYKTFRCELFRPPFPPPSLSMVPDPDEGSGPVESPFENSSGELNELTPPFNEPPAYIQGRRRSIKSIIRNNLMPAYYYSYTDSEFSYVNYNTLNFYTNGSDVADWVRYSGGVETDHSTSLSLAPTASVLIYPAFTGTWDRCDTKINSQYSNGSDGYLMFTSELSTIAGQGIRTVPDRQSNSRQTTRFAGPYSPLEGFTLSFYINPRYTNDVGSDFRAGTIMHMSSTYAVSLVTGSSKDHNGQSDAFRIMLQLSHSADVRPSKCSITASSNRLHDGVHSHDLIFLTRDNALKRNNWHHVAIRWGGVSTNMGSGSFVIDANFKDPDYFVCTASSISLQVIDESLGLNTVATTRTDTYGFDNGTNPRIIGNSNRKMHLQAPGDDSSQGTSLTDPNALFIGNYYEGTNRGESEIIRFFNIEASVEQGTPTPYYDWNIESGYTGGVQFTKDPVSFKFNHPLNAEIHNIRMNKIYIEDETLYSSSIVGAETPEQDSLDLYIPPFFTRGTKHRRYMVTATQSSLRKNQDNEYIETVSVFPEFTQEPFNAGLSFNIAAPSINLENFCREFTQGVYPRLLNLTSSAAINPPRGYGAYSAYAGITSAPLDEPNIQIDTKRMGYRLNEQGITGLDFLYATGSFTRRNLSILPNDNGLFQPNYQPLVSGTVSDYPVTGSEMASFVNGKGELDLSVININNLIPQTEKFFRDSIREVNRSGIEEDVNRWQTDQFIDAMLEMSAAILISSDDDREAAYPTKDLVGYANPDGKRPQDVNVNEAGITRGIDMPPINPQNTTFFFTGDPSSEEVGIFTLSNLFYGNKINPGTFVIKDSNLTGSHGKISITLKDDSSGGLYRADCETPHAAWNTVGNIFYNEGVGIIKSPHISLFGKSGYELNLRGEQNTHVLAVNVPCRTAEFNSSSNPSYKLISASLNVNDNHKEFVYITGMYIHDDNYNVIMKVNLAQPIMKRVSDSYLLRAKIDF